MWMILKSPLFWASWSTWLAFWTKAAEDKSKDFDLWCKEAAEDKSKDFDLWCKEQKDESFIYFFGILKHLLNINLFVRSIREASFDLLVVSLEQLCPLQFALDHIHYSKWLPVFMHDLKLLKILDPALYHSFSKGRENWYSIQQNSVWPCTWTKQQSH